MAIVIRWAVLSCVLSVGLASACDSASKCEPSVPCSGVAGDSSTGGDGSSNLEAGNAGSSSNAGTSSNANAGSAGSRQGGAGNTGNGGTASGAGAAGALNGGASGSAGSAQAGSAQAGSAGSAQAGAGGTPGGSNCGGAQVLFLIQRSGALFEQPGLANTGEKLALEASYFGFLQAALAGNASAAKPYSGKLSIGVSFLFATRDAVNAIPAICPQLAETTPSPLFDGRLTAAFSQSVTDHDALVTAKQKEEAPVPESIASAVASWSGASGARHLVLITTAMPDTCTLFDGPCGIDATVKAVQAAKAAGVTTHVIGLGHDNQFNYPSADPEPVAVQTGYEEYLQQLANAGSGKPVGPPNVEKLQDYACGTPEPAVLTASYSAAPGDAKYHQVKTATDAKTAVAEILASICP